MTGLSLKARISAALAEEGLKPLHRLGQNFMIEERAVAALVDAAGPGPGVRIAEIGPGTGVLTERMVDAGAEVLAVELDQGLARYLTRALVPRGLRLVQGDALATKNRLHPELEAFAAAGPWRLASNLPYDVALPVILNAVALPQPPERIVVTIQKEAAERLVSRPGDDAWGATAAVLQAAGTAKIVRILPPGCFFPAPRVDSAILVWTPQRPLPAGFGTWCREVFAYRRKVVPGALRDAGMVRARGEAACAACGIDPSRRLEGLDAPELVALFAALAVEAPQS
jgi:16S rRNA (adenine1518-N6/adenine1519-N6)-dimethyltransferase